MSVALVVAAVGAIYAWTVIDGRGASPPSAANVICDIDPADGEAAITAAVNSCPNGTADAAVLVRFPAGRSYTQHRRIEVRDRRHLVIDGNGSTFTTSSNGAVTKSVDPNWLVLRGFGITLKNMTVRGDFTAYEGQPRSLATISPDPEFTEAQMGIGLYGANTVRIEDVKAFNNWGDGLTTGPAHYADDRHVGSDDYTMNVTVDRMTVETVGRHCWSPNSGENIVIRNGSCADAWYGGIDAEADHLRQPLRGHKYLNNTFQGFGHLGIFIPVAGDPGLFRDYEIRGNKFFGPLDKPCNTVIGVGGYPDSNPATFHNVIVTGNEIEHYGPAIVYDHVDGGSITANILTRAVVPGWTPEGYCGGGALSVPIRVTNSVNVTEDANTVR